MFSSIEQERTDVLAQASALRQIESTTFRSGDTVLLGSEPLPLLIAAGVDPGAPQRHFVSFGGRIHVPELVQRLACGILTDEKTVFATARMDSNGQFAVDLPDGRYSVRFVIQIRDDLDIDILRRIADDSAFDLLEVAATIETVADELRQRVQQVLRDLRPASKSSAAPVQAAVTAGIPEPTDVRAQLAAQEQPLDIFEPAVNLSLCAGEQKPDTDPGQAIGWWVEPVEPREPERLVFRCPASRSKFPYSAVVVQVLEGEQIVGRGLMPVARDDAGLCYGNTIEFVELLGDLPFNIASMRVIFWAEAPAIRKRVKLDEVAAALETPYVSRQPEVRAGLTRLRDDLAGQKDRRQRKKGAHEK